MLVPPRSRPLALAPVLLLVTLAPAAASPLEDTTVGGAVFTGPTHAHATAMYINPAALGLAPVGTHVYLGGSLRLDRYHIERQRILDASGTAEPAPPVDALTVTPGGTLAFYSVGTTATLGAAVGLPLNQEFIAGRDALGYHTLGGHHRQLAWLSLAASFRVNDRLLVGTGLSLTTTSLEFSFLRDTALELGTGAPGGACDRAPCPIEDPRAAERYDVAVGSDGLLSTQNLSINAGAVYQVAQDWWVGAGYQSPAGLQAPLSLRGTVEVTPAPAARPPECDPDAGACADRAQAEVIYRLPQTVWLGVRGPIAAGLELVAQARWQNLSRHRLFDLRIFGQDVAPTTPEWYPRYIGLRDVVTVAAGIEAAVTQRLRLGGRARVESGATATRALSPLQVEHRNYTAGAGAELRLLDGLTLTASYGLTWFPRTTVTDSEFDPLDRLACEDSGHDLDTCAATAEGRAIPSAAGTYERFRHAARLAVRYSFL